MGASVAVEMAARANLPVSGIVAVGTVALAPDLTAEIDELAAITAGKARRQFDQTGYAPDSGREIYGAAFQEWVKTDPRSTVNDRRGQAAWDGAASSAKVTCPVSVVVGEHTEDDHRGAAEAFAAALSNGSTSSLAGAGRRGVIEQPTALAGLIDEFAANLGGAA
ncbi:MAG: alpha/beta hydrolase, partial [Actinomycetota bacterium]|nr:alpha/beta hydrolase [Actinomycetota bacterium]